MEISSSCLASQPLSIIILKFFNFDKAIDSSLETLVISSKPSIFSNFIVISRSSISEMASKLVMKGEITILFKCGLFSRPSRFNREGQELKSIFPSSP